MLRAHATYRFVLDLPYRTRTDSVLRNFDKHSFVFLGSTHEIETLCGAVCHFRRLEPVRQLVESVANWAI